jgi:3'-phosphoadenosine 5'-phosphosulfate sulfotransferase (PAPS reductase)/FAD synthetase
MARPVADTLDLFAWSAQRAAPPPPARLPPPPVAVRWPDLQKWAKRVESPDAKEIAKAARERREPKPRAVRFMQMLLDGDALARRVGQLAQPRRGDFPAARATAYDGSPYPWPSIASPDVVRALVDAGALFVVSDSGGKDSQAQGILLSRVVPREQLLFIHATLPGAEWPGTLEQAEGHARAAGAAFVVAQAGKTFLGMVDGRFRDRPGAPSWPSPTYRQCTSDLKRGPIQSAVLEYAERNGFRIIIDAAGLRSLESPLRAKQPVWGLEEERTLDDRIFKNHTRIGRLWVRYLPIHHLTRREVSEVIAAAGQHPHPAYLAGTSGCPCIFQHHGSPGDLRAAPCTTPEVYEEFVRREEQTGWAFRDGERLPSITGLTVEEAKRRRRTLPVWQGSFDPSQVSVEETFEENPCGGNDEWSE